MDHHYSKDMYFLKAASDEAPAPDEKDGIMETDTGDVSVEDALDETPTADTAPSEPEPIDAEPDNETPPEDKPE